MSGLINGLFVDSLEIAGCEIAHYGGCGIALGGNRSWHTGIGDSKDYDAQLRGRITNTLIRSNVITDGGGGGIRVDDFPTLVENTFTHEHRLPSGLFGDPVTHTDQNKIQGNAIALIGRLFADAPAIRVVDGFDTQVGGEIKREDDSVVQVGNCIDRTPQMGIVIGNKDPRSFKEAMVVSYNKVSRAMQVLVDGAAIYVPGARGLKFDLINLCYLRHLAVIQYSIEQAGISMYTWTTSQRHATFARIIRT
jgi:hypothetical protein